MHNSNLNTVQRHSHATCEVAAPSSTLPLLMCFVLCRHEVCKIIDKHREVDLINVIPDRMRNFPVMSIAENFLLISHCYNRSVGEFLLKHGTMTFVCLQRLEGLEMSQICEIECRCPIKLKINVVNIRNKEILVTITQLLYKIYSPSVIPLCHRYYLGQYCSSCDVITVNCCSCFQTLIVETTT